MKKLVSLFVAIVMLMSLSTIAFAAERVQAEEEDMEPISVVTFDDGTIVEEYGDGISFVYYEAEETAPSKVARAYGQQSATRRGTLVDNGVQKYWIQVYGTFNVTTSIVTCISRSESHGVIDGTDYTFENPHAWHDPANGGSTCWAHASVTAKKWWGGIVIKNMNFDIKVGFNTSGQMVQ